MSLFQGCPRVYMLIPSPLPPSHLLSALYLPISHLLSLLLLLTPSFRGSLTVLLPFTPPPPLPLPPPSPPTQIMDTPFSLCVVVPKYSYECEHREGFYTPPIKAHYHMLDVLADKADLCRQVVQYATPSMCVCAKVYSRSPEPRK